MLTHPSNLRLTTGHHYQSSQPVPNTSFTNPPPARLNGAGTTPAGGITAPLAYCGSTTACPDVQDKICLLQRGGAPMCVKVKACMDGGGKAAIIYNKNGSMPCESLSGGTLVSTPQTGPIPGCDDSTAYIPALALSLSQGEAIKALLDAAQAVTATVILPDFEFIRQVDMPIISLGPSLTVLALLLRLTTEVVSSGFTIHLPPAEHPQLWVRFGYLRLLPLRVCR